MTVSAFPWRALDSLRHADLAHLARLRRAVGRIIDSQATGAKLREMIAPSELSVRVRRVTSSPPRVDEAAIGVLLAPADRADRRRAIAVLMEQSLASALAGRVLRRPTPRVGDPAAHPTQSLAGAMAALLVAAARRGGATPLRVLAAGPAHTVLGEVVSVDSLPLGVTFTVTLDHDAFIAHAYAPRSALEGRDEEVMDARKLATLGATPLAIPVVAATFVMTATELAALKPGDALVPLDLQQLLLAAPTSDVAFSVSFDGVAGGGRLVLRDGPQLLEEPNVDKDALAQSIGETPVVVRVEVGEAQMTAREWASLGAGDVVALGKRIGEHVVLRVAGVEVARGELVDIEGEVGVRIVARAGATVA
jgi:flagellar motor switch/type III secretory pathway protein FliN